MKNKYNLSGLTFPCPLRQPFLIGAIWSPEGPGIFEGGHALETNFNTPTYKVHYTILIQPIFHIVWSKKDWVLHN